MTSGRTIPFLDLATPHRELEEELVEAFRGIVRSAGFIGGPLVEKFEQDFAALCETSHCVGVGSGTDALRFALLAAGIRPNDIVVTVPNTFVATVEAILQVGATPRFIDVDADTYLLDVAALGEYLESRCDRSGSDGQLVDRSTGQPVRAVVPVHLYGQMCDMDAIASIAHRFDLKVIEDACQAHGSEYFSEQRGRWCKAGSVGDAAAFSFYPGKNLGACGEAGAVTTDDRTIADRIRMIRDHGQAEKYHHSMEGYNGRLDAMQAAALGIKLPLLSEWNAKRRGAAATYTELFANEGSIRVPSEPPWSRSVYHLYVIQSSHRDQLQKHLADCGIASGLHYPVPIHLQAGYRHLEYRTGDFPVAEMHAGRILSLPMHPHLTRGDQERVAEAVAQFEPGNVIVPAGSGEGV